MIVIDVHTKRLFAEVEELRRPAKFKDEKLMIVLKLERAFECGASNKIRERRRQSGRNM